MPPKSKLISVAKKNYAKSLTHMEYKDLEKIVNISQKDIKLKLLPHSVAEDSTINDVPKKLILNFDFFKPNICDFSKSIKAQMKSLLVKFAKVCDFTEQEFPTCDLNPRLVFNNGDYQLFFNHLSKDIEDLFEIDISGWGRFYGFISQGLFHLIAVDTKHKNTH